MSMSFGVRSTWRQDVHNPMDGKSSFYHFFTPAGSAIIGKLQYLGSPGGVLNISNFPNLHAAGLLHDAYTAALTTSGTAVNAVAFAGSIEGGASRSERELGVAVSSSVLLVDRGSGTLAYTAHYNYLDIALVGSPRDSTGAVSAVAPVSLSPHVGAGEYFADVSPSGWRPASLVGSLWSPAASRLMLGSICYNSVTADAGPARLRKFVYTMVASNRELTWNSAWATTATGYYLKIETSSPTLTPADYATLAAWVAHKMG